jgi:hypothetical protein
MAYIELFYNIDLDQICRIVLRLLVCLAVQVGPGSLLLDAIEKKFRSKSFDHKVDQIAELEFHINTIYSSLGRTTSFLFDESIHDSWKTHTIFGDLELKKLRDVSLNVSLHELK